MREPPKRTAEEIAEEIATTADAKQAALAESAKLYESEEGETVKPHWPGMFRFAEQLVSESDMEGKDYILQMLAYGRQLSDSDDRMNEKFKEQFQRWGRKERPLAENPIPPAIMPTYTPRSFNELLAYIHK